uniref:Uncharacterized protein n=1 Tax=Arundo donax TaxID=35708 RepID=A0A0A9G1F2_ARUDO
MDLKMYSSCYLSLPHYTEISLYCKSREITTAT